MKKALQSLILLLAALLPLTASADYVQLADGVYRDGSTLYITSSVTTLGPLQVNPSVVYSFAAVPPACVENTFTSYGATLHMPATSYGAYFVADYWGNFANMYNDAVEPQSVTISSAERRKMPSPRTTVPRDGAAASIAAIEPAVNAPSIRSTSSESSSESASRSTFSRA